MTQTLTPYGVPFNGVLSYYKFSPGAVAPVRAYSKSAAFDLAACLGSKTLTIGPSQTTMVPTGLALLPPGGHFIEICSRSGLAGRGVFVANAPGIIDPDYTGEVKVLLFNGGIEPMYVRHGDRIGQALVLPIHLFQLREVKELPQTERGDRGFGSSGR